MSAELSQHPVDRLIRDLIQTGRPANEAEIKRIIERMATAPFDRRQLRVRIDERGASYQGQILASRVDARIYHLVKRVAIERQWAPGTSFAEYLTDLRRAVRSPSARIAVYGRRAGHVAVSITPTDRVLAPERRGARPLPQLLVVYAADRGMMISGYQFSDLRTTGIPGRAIWLR